LREFSDRRSDGEEGQKHQHQQKTEAKEVEEGRKNWGRKRRRGNHMEEEE
jgi:hypothetical protein